MRRGTTPTFNIECDVDLTGYTIFVTLEQGNKELTLMPECEATEDGCVLSVTLTQEQTLVFDDRGAASMPLSAHTEQRSTVLQRRLTQWSRT